MKRFAVLAAAALVVTGCAAQTPPPVSAKVQDYYDKNVVGAKPAVVTSAPAASLKLGSFKAAADKLRSTEEPFTLTVVGDSTGFPDQGWVVQSLKDINSATGRTIELHTWNNETGKYGAPRTIGEGAPTMTVWNGSAPGKDAQYSLQRLDILIPTKPDLLVINHGHNVKLTSTIRALLVQASAQAGPKAAVAIMKQNPESSAGQSFQASRMAMVEATAKEFKGVELIDAYSAFDVKNSDLFVSDGIHPTAEGYRLWADVFLRRLGFA